MKGSELPVNMLVIMGIALVVLLAVVGFVVYQWVQGTGSIDMQSEHSRACGILAQTGCDNPSAVKVKIVSNAAITNLQLLCDEMGIGSTCKESCGCS